MDSYNTTHVALCVYGIPADTILNAVQFLSREWYGTWKIIIVTWRHCMGLLCVYVTPWLLNYHDTSSEIRIYLAITNFTLQHHLCRKNLINIYLSNTSHTALKRTNSCNFHFTCVCGMKGQGSYVLGVLIQSLLHLSYTKCTHLMYWYTIMV